MSYCKAKISEFHKVVVNVLLQGENFRIPYSGPPIKPSQMVVNVPLQGKFVRPYLIIRPSQYHIFTSMI